MKLKIFSLVTLSILLFLSCESMVPVATITIDDENSVLIIEREAGTGEDVPSYPIPDITPAGMKLKVLSFSPTKSDQTNDYIIRYNVGIELLNKKSYEAAALWFLKMAEEYADAGVALYYTGVCYYNLNEREKALTYFASAYGKRNKKALERIGQVCFDIGYEFLKQEKWVDAIRYLKISPAIKATSQNVLYCYDKYATALPASQQAFMLLYAGWYMIENELTTDNVLAIGSKLGNLFKNDVSSPYLTDVATVLAYVCKVKNDPYIRMNLGLVYLNMKEQAKALEQFKAGRGAAGADKNLLAWFDQKIKELTDAQ